MYCLVLSNLIEITITFDRLEGRDRGFFDGLFNGAFCAYFKQSYFRITYLIKDSRFDSNLYQVFGITRQQVFTFVYQLNDLLLSRKESYKNETGVFVGVNF